MRLTSGQPVRDELVGLPNAELPEHLAKLHAVGDLEVAEPNRRESNPLLWGAARTLKSVSRKISSHSRRSPQNDRMPAGEPVRVQLRPSGATRPRPVTECLVAMDITVLMARLCSGFRGSSHHVIDDVFVQRPRIEQSSHHVFDVFAQASDVSFSSDGTAGSHPVGLLASQRTAFRPNRLDVLVEEQDRAEGLVLRPDRRQGAVADRPRVLEDRLVRHRPLFK